MNEIFKRVIIIVAVVLVVILIAGFVVGNYFYSLALDPHSDKSVLAGPSSNTTATQNPDAEQDDAWFEASGYSDEYMDARDGLRLHAYEIVNKEPSERWVLIAHGYSGNGLEMAASARKWYGMGYNLLLPEARGHGKSEGDYIGMGWHERLDVVDWLGRLNEKYAETQIALYGVSMGGATVMMTAGEKLPANVRAIVEDCGYTSAKDEFAYQLKRIFGLPSFPILNFADLVTQMRAGYSFVDASAIEQVAKSVTPMLFIHGSEDSFVPAYMLDEVYDAAPVEKEKLLVEGAVHGTAHLVGGEVYWQTIEQFVDRFME